MEVRRIDLVVRKHPLNRCSYCPATDEIQLCGHKRAHWSVEEVIETILQHETLHSILKSSISLEVMYQLDEVSEWEFCPEPKIVIKHVH